MYRGAAQTAQSVPHAARRFPLVGFLHTVRPTRHIGGTALAPSGYLHATVYLDCLSLYPLASLCPLCLPSYAWLSPLPRLRYFLRLPQFCGEPVRPLVVSLN